MIDGHTFLIHFPVKLYFRGYLLRCADGLPLPGLGHNFTTNLGEGRKPIWGGLVKLAIIRIQEGLLVVYSLGNRKNRLPMRRWPDPIRPSRMVLSGRPGLMACRGRVNNKMHMSSE